MRTRSSVDGLDIDSDIGEGVNNLTPNVDALSEVAVQTNTYNVDYGKSSEIETLMTSRAGTRSIMALRAVTTRIKRWRHVGSTACHSRHACHRFTPRSILRCWRPHHPKKQFFFFRYLEPYYSSTPNPALNRGWCSRAEQRQSYH